ncbi:MAG: tRNA (N(6)-L-threonylcarbamoyladenosine(37)-C(2))-methylthiotransferase MtaB [Nitrospirae bacterium]|nr:tRNA (N(6)-L-threonylcarbamoyladenosine(37)-C(2))-methylthiotransferase MtaB [Nitrospirota bacterium]
MNKFSILTLGCKVNQSESATMRGILEAAGLCQASTGEIADVCVINTCTVTAKSDYQSRQLIRRAIRDNPGARVIVTGCYSQTRHDEVCGIDGVTSILPVNQKLDIVHHINKSTSTARDCDDISISTPPYSTERSRAFLKIQDGCNNSCAYCIVHVARGRSRSIPPDQVVGAARSLEEKGFREIVLTGVHVGFYGHDLGETRLNSLVRRLLRETSGVRYRISSIEPTEVDDELVAIIAGEERVCRHLHIPLQAAHDSVLERMNRHYSSSYYFNLLEQLRSRIPGICLGADIIAGFPGETPEMFEAGVKLINESSLDYLHVFPFSKRDGTPAASMPDQISSRDRDARAALLRDVSARKKSTFQSSMIGRKVHVIAENSDGNATTCKCLSDNYLNLRIPFGLLNRDGTAMAIVRKEYFDAPFAVS